MRRIKFITGHMVYNLAIMSGDTNQITSHGADQYIVQTRRGNRLGIHNSDPVNLRMKF